MTTHCLPHFVGAPTNSNKPVERGNMAGDTPWSGFEDGDIELVFAGEKFKVHRAITAQASPVWKSMLNTGWVDKWAEAFGVGTADALHFDGDHPEVARFCLRVIYSMSSSNSEHLEHGFVSMAPGVDGLRLPGGDPGALDAFVDKYSLRGVKRFLAHELNTAKDKERLQREVDSLNHDVRRLNSLVQNLKDEAVTRATKPGMLVNMSEYKPPLGTRVREHPDHQGSCRRLLGEIIANDEDFGTEIGVRWDNGQESHNLHCGKKRGWALEYY